MLETGLFGLNQRFLHGKLWWNKHAASCSIHPFKNGYNSSAVFHGNAGSFWNRNTTYKQWGYNYFFDAAYFSKQK